MTVGLIAQSADADRTTHYTYTPEGLISTIDGPRIDVPDIITYGYDAQGNQIIVRNALGHEVNIISHDGSGRPLTVIDPNGLTTRLTYDLRGRLVTESVSDGVDIRTTDYSYDAAGNLTQVNKPDGSILKYDYDAANRLIGIEDANGNRVDFTLDSMGNRLETRVRDPAGTLTRYRQQVYNKLGRLIETVDSKNRVTGYNYDANGNLTQTTDANLNPTEQGYDALDRLQKTIDALNGTTQYAYDGQDNLTSVTDPNGLTTTYEYDGLGNLIKQISPDTGTTTYTYDEAGNRLSKTDARGITVSYGYDSLNRLTRISYPDASLNVRFSYDQGINGISRLTGMSDVNGKTSYTYNGFGELLSKTRISSDNVTTVFFYSYDSAGRLFSLTYPSGRKLYYEYDGYGNVISISLASSDATAQPLVQNIQQLPFGPVGTFEYGNGLSYFRVYDLDYQLIKLVIPGILQSSYLHDPVGNIINWKDLLDTGRDQQFAYDQLSRLINASGDFGSYIYTYDSVGNRLSLFDVNNYATWSYSYALDSHRLQSILGGVADNRHYDAAGNTLQSLIGSYTYDATNRMAGFDKSGISSRYAYNGMGERVNKRLNGVMTRYRYGEGAQLLGEYDAYGQSIREYVYLADQPVALLTRDPETQAETVYYLHTDHLGAVVKATDSSRRIVWDAQRKPFGGLTARTAEIKMPLGYPGQYYDEESGNYYNYFRDYDPSTGRYLQSDPIGLEGGLNTYAYVRSNPVMRYDYLGLAEICNVGLPVSLGIPHTFLCSSGTCGGKHGGGSGPSLFTPDSQIKDDIGDLPDASCSHVPEMKCDPVSFNDCVEKKLKPRKLNEPYYFSGSNCGTWAVEVIAECRAKCKKVTP